MLSLQQDSRPMRKNGSKDTERDYLMTLQHKLCFLMKRFQGFEVEKLNLRNNFV